MPPNALHKFEFVDFRNETPCCCCRITNGKLDQERKKYESFNILNHEVIPSSKCVKKVLKSSTTYRDHFGRKCKPKRQKIFLPFPGIHFSEDRMCGISTYKGDYHPYSLKDQQASKGEMIDQKRHLTYSKQKFEAKSETKAAFRCPKVTQNNSLKGTKGVLSGVIKKCENDKFTSITTYSSDFKKPKCQDLAVSFKPKHHIIVSKEPLKTISQYMNDFKIPRK